MKKNHKNVNLSHKKWQISEKKVANLWKKTDKKLQTAIRCQKLVKKSHTLVKKVIKSDKLVKKRHKNVNLSDKNSQTSVKKT